MGIDTQLSPNVENNLFRAIRPGYVAFRPEGLKVIKEFYIQDGGTLTELKDGKLAGKSKAGDEIHYVPEADVKGVFEAQLPKPPTEAQASANHAEAARAGEQLELRSQKCTELLVAKLADGHVVHKFGRIIQGTGLAAALDANTLPGAQRGANPAPLEALPETIGVGTGPDTFAKLGDMPIGQAAPELGGPGWAMEPGQFTASHGKYAPATVLADATTVTQYRSGTPIVDAAILEMSTTPDATWKVPDARVQIKVRLPRHGEVFLYTDATDIALGLGKPRELELGQIAPGDNAAATRYKQQLEAEGPSGSPRLIYGDKPAQQGGGKVLVSGGSATGAWNARYARKLGAEVDWISEDRDPNRAPTNNDSVRRYERVQKMLENGEIARTMPRRRWRRSVPSTRRRYRPMCRPGTLR
jgi:hypothetical protein